MKILFLLSLILSCITIVQSSKTNDTRCDLSRLAEFQQFNNETGWHFKVNPCGFHHMGSDEIVGMLKGKSVLFVGDSTVRNPALVFLAQMCNPTHYDRCQQRISILSASKGSGTMYNCGENATDNTCGEIQERYTAFTNLTTNRFYSNSAERKMFWRKEKVPPVVTLTYRGVELHLLTAGCLGRKDGFPFVLDYLLTHELPFRYDMIVMGGGLHCTYRNFRRDKWYRAVFSRFPAFQALGIATIWMETTHCTKQNRYQENTKVSCPFIDRYAAVVRNTALANGARLVHTRHITRRLSRHYRAAFDGYLFDDALRKESCVFEDPIHPSAACSGVIGQSLAATLKRTLDDMKSQPATVEPLPKRLPAEWKVVSDTALAKRLQQAEQPDTNVVNEPRQEEIARETKIPSEASQYNNDSPLPSPSEAQKQRTALDGDSARTKVMFGNGFMLAVLLFVTGGTIAIKMLRRRNGNSVMDETNRCEHDSQAICKDVNST